MGAETDGSLINYTNGLVIIALLLVIWILSKRQLPGSCEMCIHVKENPGITGYVKYCKEECMYNPAFRGAASNSLFEKREVS